MGVSSLSFRDLLLGVLVVLAWAGNAIVIKVITLEVEPFTGLAVRLALGGLLFLPFLRWSGRARFWHITQIAAFMSVLHWGSLIWSIDRLDASMATIIMQAQVIFAVLIGRFFFAEKFGWRTGLGIGIGVLGVVVLVGLPAERPALSGVLGMAFSMLMIAIAYARMKGLSGVSSMNYMAHLHLLALLPMIGLAFVFEAPLSVEYAAIDYTVLLPALLYQIVVISASHMLWQRLMTRSAMSVLPNLTLLLPVLGVVMAVIFLGERVSVEMLIGGTITMIGVAIILLRKQKRAMP